MAKEKKKENKNYQPNTWDVNERISNEGEKGNKGKPSS